MQDLADILSNSYSWVRQFIQERGMQVISKELTRINQQHERYAYCVGGHHISPYVLYFRKSNDCQLELEIIKCLRSMLNNTVGDIQLGGGGLSDVHISL